MSAQQKVTNITNQINIIHIGDIHNHGLPDWIESDKVTGHEDQIKKVIALLETKGVKGLTDTDYYLRKEVFTYSDFVKAIKEDLVTIDRVVDLTKRTVPQKAAKIAPLTLAYNFIFNNKNANELETLHRRPFHLSDGTDACDVLTYRDETATDCVLGWEQKIWRSLLSEILHMLGVELYERMKTKNYSYITSDEETSSDEEQTEIVYHETDEQVKRAEVKQTRERQLRQKQRKRQQKARTHPYIRWWVTVVGPETLEFDPDVCKLMDNISKELIKQCKNDVRAGWHRLIDYCRALHDIEKINTQPRLNELDTAWKKYVALQHARHDLEDEEAKSDNKRQQGHYWDEIQRLKKQGLKRSQKVINKEKKHEEAIIE